MIKIKLPKADKKTNATLPTSFRINYYSELIRVSIVRSTTTRYSLASKKISARKYLMKYNDLGKINRTNDNLMGGKSYPVIKAVAAVALGVSWAFIVPATGLLLLQLLQ